MGRLAKGCVSLRFTGQVKIPDLDYPGLPAEVLVDGNHTELFVEGESLGRWSLVDVRAERLISSAFSLDLAGEQVTFIADQPTEFAYAGVDQMAKVWAKHKSMRLPLRMVANSRSRKGTKPSRVADLRNAISDALAGNPLTAIRRSDDAPDAHRPQQQIERREPERPELDRPRRVHEFKPSSPGSPAGEAPPSSHHRQPAPDPEPAALPDTPDSVFAEPEESSPSIPPAEDSIYKDSVPWAKADDVRRADAPQNEPSPEPKEPSAVEARDDRGNGEDGDLSLDPWADPGKGFDDEETPSPTRPAESPAAPPPAPASQSVPWIAPDSPADQQVPAAEPETQSGASRIEESVESVPDDVRIPERPAASEEPAAVGKKYVVDLGAFEDPDEQDPADSGREDAPEPVLAATTSPGRGGIIGAVKSAFVRNRSEHTHEYVEAPGGLGIVRQICAECGHISIGMSE